MIEIRAGSAPGARLSFTHKGGQLVSVKEGSVVSATLTGDWTEVRVLAGSGDKVRYWCIAPGDEDINVGHAGFYVRGTGMLMAQFNNARSARAAFKQFG